MQLWEMQNAHRTREMKLCKNYAPPPKKKHILTQGTKTCSDCDYSLVVKVEHVHCILPCLAYPALLGQFSRHISKKMREISKRYITSFSKPGISRTQGMKILYLKSSINKI
jgi:hypothetical protein